MDNIYRGAYSQTFTGLLSDTCAPLPPQCHVKVFFSEAGGVITKKRKGETHWVQAQWKKIYYFLIRLTKVFRSTITVSSFENTAKVLHKRLLSDWIYLKKRASLSDKICDQQGGAVCTRSLKKLRWKKNLHKNKYRKSL